MIPSLHGGADRTRSRRSTSRRLRARSGADAGHHRRGRPRPRRPAGGHAPLRRRRFRGARVRDDSSAPDTSACSRSRTVSPTSSATSSMPTITDLDRPGRPPRSAARSAGRRRPAAATGAVRAAVVFAHPHPQFGGTMHTKAVYPGREGAGADRLRGAALQFPRRRPQRGRVRPGRGREGRLPGGARLHGGALSGHAALGGRLFVRLVGRARGRRRSTIASRR